TGWTAFTVTFVANATGAMRIVLLSSGGTGTLYWDDIHIVDASGFENAPASPWPQFGGVTVVTTNSVARTRSVSLAQAGSSTGGAFLDLSGLVPGVTYQVVAFAHGDPGGTSQALLLAHDTTGANGVSDGWRTPGNGWDAFAVQFVATATGRMRIQLFSNG